MWKHRWWYLLPLLATMLLGTWHYNCIIKENCDCNDTNTTSVTPTISNAQKMVAGKFAIKDSLFSLNVNEDFIFKQNGNQAFIPVGLDKALDSFYSFEKSNGIGNKIVTVSGYYKSTEKTVAGFENLGLARAQTIKNLLIKKGYPEGNIFTKGVIKDDLIIYANDSTQGAINFDITKMGGTMSEDMLFQPRIIRFATGKNNMLVTEELKNYFAQAKDYLDKHPADKLEVTGHTDNKGDATKNDALSKQRAEFVKQELGKKEIKLDQILPDGKGQTQPIADNVDEAGRTQNRRVEVKLKKG